MKKVIAVLVLIVAAIVGLMVQPVTAVLDPIVIKANCSIAQSTLSRLEKIDVGTRLNRASDYDRLLKLMFTMNARLANNHIAAPELSVIAGQYADATALFRRNYDVYSDRLSQVIAFNCQNEPLRFYSILGEVRAARAVLHDNVLLLSQLADDYLAVFDAIWENLK